MPKQQDEPFRVRLEKLDSIRSKGIDPYPARFRRTHTTQEAVTFFEKQEKESGIDSIDEKICAAGRIVAIRRMGKVSFSSIQDGSGRIQIFLKRDILGESYELLKDLDIGDFVGANGSIFRTRTGEITVEVEEFKLLAKALRPLPEKWHGLSDIEKRFRQRYLEPLFTLGVKSLNLFVISSMIEALLRSRHQFLFQ